MARWVSVKELEREFGFLGEEHTLQDLRTHLKKIKSTSHPDHNGGNFESDAAKAEYLNAQHALDFLDQNTQVSAPVIPADLLPSIVAAVAQALSVKPAIDAIADRATYLSTIRHENSKRMMSPRITSGMSAAVTGFLVMFPDKFEKHPVLGPILATKSAQYGLLGMTIFAAVFFIFTWSREWRATAQAEYLMSESALGDILGRLDLHWQGSEICHVSSWDILQAIQPRRHMDRQLTYLGPWQRIFGKLFRSTLSTTSLEKIAAFQTQRLIERKVLTPTEQVSAIPMYSVDKSIRRW